MSQKHNLVLQYSFNQNKWQELTRFVKNRLYWKFWSMLSSTSIFKSQGGFPLGEMNGDFAAKFISACTFLFVYGLAGEIFLFENS